MPDDKRRTFFVQTRPNSKIEKIISSVSATYLINDAETNKLAHRGGFRGIERAYIYVYNIILLYYYYHHNINVNTFYDRQHFNIDVYLLFFFKTIPSRRWYIQRPFSKNIINKRINNSNVYRFRVDNNL